MTTQFITQAEFSEVKKKIASLQIQTIELLLGQPAKTTSYSETPNTLSEAQSPKREQPGKHRYLGMPSVDQQSLQLDSKIRSYMELNGTDYATSYEIITQQ